ncbi:hypothetical protein KC326_g58 [Hortaea werneckii]|nr:hypothetical protein KC326_g58 [Hortaea werneckii]
MLVLDSRLARKLACRSRSSCIFTIRSSLVRVLRCLGTARASNTCSSSDGVVPKLERLDRLPPFSALSASSGVPSSSTAVSPPILETGERSLPGLPGLHELAEVRADRLNLHFCLETADTRGKSANLSDLAAHFLSRCTVSIPNCRRADGARMLLIVCMASIRAECDSTQDSHPVAEHTSLFGILRANVVHLEVFCEVILIYEALKDLACFDAGRYHTHKCSVKRLPHPPTSSRGALSLNARSRRERAELHEISKACQLLVRVVIAATALRRKNFSHCRRTVSSRPTHLEHRLRLALFRRTLEASRGQGIRLVAAMLRSRIGNVR